MIALYPGGFKPPHRGHFEVVKSLLNGTHGGKVYDVDSYTQAGLGALKGEPDKLQPINKVLVFIGGGERNGITKEESMAVWRIYSKYLPGIQIMDGEKNPMFAAKDYAKAHPEDKFYAVTGVRSEEDIPDLRRITTFKNRDNVQGLVIPSAEGAGVRATDFRKAILSGNLDEVLDFFPKELTNDEILKIMNMLKSSIIAEMMEENLDSTLNELFDFSKSKEVYKLDIPKFSQEKTLPQLLSNTLYEIKLSKDNAVDIDGDLTGGTFKVEDITYEYSIKNIPNPYKDSGVFYSVQFTPKGENISTPTQTNSPKSYIKILSTMYKVISDFTEKEKPEYIGISSLDNSTSKNYHLIYNALTDPKNNHLPNYFRKDVRLPFDTPKQGSGRFVVLKRRKQTENSNMKLQKEGSSGTAIAPQSATRSADRAKLVTLYNRLRNVIGDQFYDIGFNQDHITIRNKEEGQRVGFDYTPYMASILEYMIDEGMNIVPLPEVKIKRDIAESTNFFGRTAYYDSVKKEVVLYVEGRHPKDVMRSFAHEMIHHKQNLEGTLGNIGTTNTNEDDHLLEIEKQAYLEGNITFRNWEDSLKNS